MSISACIISKNEEKNIERCLKSIVKYVDEIIVVDTGSTDTTINIVKKYTDKIFYTDWENDFSKARNFSIDKATMNWILIIDCDEELDSKSAHLLKELLNSNEAEAYGVLLSNIINNVVTFTFQSLRIFKNKKEYRFHSPIHEQVGDVIQKLNGPFSVMSSRVSINHYGYDVDSSTSLNKSKRNLYILNTIPSEERDSLFYYHLSNEYIRLNNFEQATIELENGFKLSSPTTPNHTILIHKLVECLISLKRFNEALDYSNKFLDIYPDFKAMLFLNAIANLENKNYNEALLKLNKYKVTSTSLSKYPNINYDSQNDINHIINQLEIICDV